MLSTKAYPYCLGASFSSTQQDESEKPIALASHSLSKSEKPQPN